MMWAEFIEQAKVGDLLYVKDHQTTGFADRATHGSYIFLEFDWGYPGYIRVISTKRNLIGEIYVVAFITGKLMVEIVSSFDACSANTPDN